MKKGNVEILQPNTATGYRIYLTYPTLGKKEEIYMEKEDLISLKSLIEKMMMRCVTCGEETLEIHTHTVSESEALGEKCCDNCWIWNYPLDPTSTSKLCLIKDCPCHQPSKEDYVTTGVLCNGTHEDCPPNKHLTHYKKPLHARDGRGVTHEECDQVCKNSDPEFHEKLKENKPVQKPIEKLGLEVVRGTGLIHDNISEISEKVDEIIEYLKEK